MPLIDDYLPIFRFSEKHACIIAAEPKAILDAVELYRPESDPFFRIMIAIRELPMPVFLKPLTDPVLQNWSWDLKHFRWMMAAISL